MESVGFPWIVLSWLLEIFEFFTVLQGDLGPTEYFYLQVFLCEVMFLKFDDNF